MMWKVVPFVILAALVLLGCNPDEQPDSEVADDVAIETQAAEPEPVEPVRGPEECFPTARGTRWEYTITLEGSDAPLQYECFDFPDAGYGSTIRGRLGLYAEDRWDDGFRLIIEVKDETATEQFPLQYPQAIELEVVEDDLGIFNEHLVYPDDDGVVRGHGTYADYTHIYWAITSSGGYGGYQVTQVVTDRPDPLALPFASEAERESMADGYSKRLIMVEESPGTTMSLNGDDDQLAFVDRTADNQLHYQRVVAAREDAEDDDPFEGNKGFTEDTWFKKGVGLQRLEQRVEGELRMIWELTKFTPGP